MLDTALEPSYNLSKNLLLLPWILKLIVDMVNDSTPVDMVNDSTPLSIVTRKAIFGSDFIYAETYCVQILSLIATKY